MFYPLNLLNQHACTSDSNKECTSRPEGTCNQKSAKKDVVFAHNVWLLMDRSQIFWGSTYSPKERGQETPSITVPTFMSVISILYFNLIMTRVPLTFFRTGLGATDIHKNNETHDLNSEEDTCPNNNLLRRYPSHESITGRVKKRSVYFTTPSLSFGLADKLEKSVLQPTQMMTCHAFSVYGVITSRPVAVAEW